MLCCALGLATLLTGASARGLRALFGVWPAALVAGGSAVVLALLVPQHLGHYRDRALAHDRSVFAEIVAAPLCAGGQRTASAG